ncbi:MAG: hypothetical protein INH41_26170 [Myxococcaceae bacterium]|jgi:hypothetical protein|nr:hypothetical protein [Myxococcaceae bacterium]MCA3015888.1 hypothetical protein [Myxococcaceae bacterium]
MLSLCLVLSLAQVQAPAEPAADAPVAPALTPAAEGVPPPELPPTLPADPKQTPRIWLTGAAGLAGAAAGFGLILLFAQLRMGLMTSGASFDTTFSTGALGGVLVAGFGLATHQLLGGRGEPALAALASVACMLISAFAVSLAQLDPVASAGLVAAIGAVPAAVSVTAILEATGAVSRGRVRAW